MPPSLSRGSFLVWNRDLTRCVFIPKVVFFIQKASAEEWEFRCRMMFHIQEVVVFIQKASVRGREGLVAEENRVAPEASDRQESGWTKTWRTLMQCEIAPPQQHPVPETRGMNEMEMWKAVEETGDKRLQARVKNAYSVIERSLALYK